MTPQDYKYIGSALQNALSQLGQAYGQRIVRSRQQEELGNILSRINQPEFEQTQIPGMDISTPGGSVPTYLPIGIPGTERSAFDRRNLPDLSRLAELSPTAFAVLQSMQPRTQFAPAGSAIMQTGPGGDVRSLGQVPFAERPDTSTTPFEAYLQLYGGDRQKALEAYNRDQINIAGARIEAQANANAQFPAPTTVTTETGDVVSVQTPKRGGKPQVYQTGVKAKIPGVQERVGDREVIDMATTMLDIMKTIRQDYDRRFVGGILAGAGGTLGGLREATGAIKEREARFRNNLQTIFNLYGQSVSGKVLTANEMARLEKQIPNAGMSRTQFEVAMGNFESTLRRILEERKSHFGGKAEPKVDNDPLKIR